MAVAGATAATPSTRSSGAYDAASSPANKAEWPPSESPNTSALLPAAAAFRPRAARAASSTPASLALAHE